MSDDTLKEKQSPWDNENWFTDAYGYINTGVVPLDWNTLTGGKGYKEILDNPDLVYDENYDKILKPEKELPKDEQEERQTNLEDEMRAMSESQAYLLENPNSGMGGHKIGDKTYRELMSEIGNDGEGYTNTDNGKKYTADDLEAMSDIELYNLALQNEDFSKYLTDTYGAEYAAGNAFNDQYLNADLGDKEALTRDIFLGNDAYEIDPVIQAQLMQRVYNANPEIANMDPKNQDEIIKSIMDVYGFNDPLDLAQWVSNEDYFNANPLTYDAQAELIAADMYGATNGFGGMLNSLGVDPNDVMAYAALGNAANRGDMFGDRYNGYMSGYDRDSFLTLLGLTGVGDQYMQSNFDNNNPDGNGAYKFKDWKDPGRNWSLPGLYQTAANATPEDNIAQLLGVNTDPITGNPVFTGANEKFLADALQNNYRYGARTPQPQQA